MRQGKRLRQSRQRAKLSRSRWPAQDAKARFSELIRRAREEGPQIITVHGREVATVSAFEPNTGHAAEGETGARLVEIMQACPVKDFLLDLPPMHGEFRDVQL